MGRIHSEFDPAPGTAVFLAAAGEDPAECAVAFARFRATRPEIGTLVVGRGASIAAGAADLWTLRAADLGGVRRLEVVGEEGRRSGLPGIALDLAGEVGLAGGGAPVLAALEELVLESCAAVTMPDDPAAAFPRLTTFSAVSAGTFCDERNHFQWRELPAWARSEEAGGGCHIHRQHLGRAVARWSFGDSDGDASPGYAEAVATLATLVAGRGGRVAVESDGAPGIADELVRARWAAPPREVCVAGCDPPDYDAVAAGNAAAVTLVLTDEPRLDELPELGPGRRLAVANPGGDIGGGPAFFGHADCVRSNSGYLFLGDCDLDRMASCRDEELTPGIEKNMRGADKIFLLANPFESGINAHSDTAAMVLAIDSHGALAPFEKLPALADLLVVVNIGDDMSDFFWLFSAEGKKEAVVDLAGLADRAPNLGALAVDALDGIGDDPRVFFSDFVVGAAQLAQFPALRIVRLVCRLDWGAQGGSALDPQATLPWTELEATVSRVEEIAEIARRLPALRQLRLRLLPLSCDRLAPPLTPADLAPLLGDGAPNARVWRRLDLTVCDIRAVGYGTWRRRAADAAPTPAAAWPDAPGARQLGADGADGEDGAEPWNALRPTQRVGTTDFGAWRVDRAAFAAAFEAARAAGRVAGGVLEFAEFDWACHTDPGCD